MSTKPENVIIRLTSTDLRKIANQLDAYSKLQESGADFLTANTQIRVDGRALAYLSWWQAEERYMAEFLNFVPGDASPLIWHCED